MQNIKLLSLLKSNNNQMLLLPESHASSNGLSEEMLSLSYFVLKTMRLDKKANLKEHFFSLEFNFYK